MKKQIFIISAFGELTAFVSLKAAQDAVRECGYDVTFSLGSYRDNISRNIVDEDEGLVGYVIEAEGEEE